MYKVSSPMKEATDCRLEFLLGLMEKCSCLDEVPGCQSFTSKYVLYFPLGCCPSDTTWSG